MTEEAAKTILLAVGLYIGIGRAFAEWLVTVYTEFENFRGRVVWKDEARFMKWIVALLWPVILLDSLR